jgi:hypothetical protein
MENFRRKGSFVMRHLPTGQGLLTTCPSSLVRTHKSEILHRPSRLVGVFPAGGNDRKVIDLTCRTPHAGTYLNRRSQPLPARLPTRSSAMKKAPRRRERSRRSENEP